MRFLKANFEAIRHLLLTSDVDWVHVNEGSEGTGKTTLGAILCKIVDPDFNARKQVGYNFEQIADMIDDAPPHAATAIMLDEGGENLFSREAMSYANREFIKLFMRIRKKNLFFCINIPRITDLDAFMREHRVKGLARTIAKIKYAKNQEGHYEPKLIRGRMFFWNAKGVKKIDKVGRHWVYPKPSFKDNFPELAGPDWEAIKAANEAYLETLKENRQTYNASTELDTDILLALKSLLNGDASKRILVKDVGFKLAQTYGSTPDWLKPRALSVRIKNLGFAKMPNSTEGANYLVFAERVDTQLDAFGWKPEPEIETPKEMKKE